MLSPFRFSSHGLVALCALTVGSQVAAQQMPEELMEALSWRELGPSRGGRVAAVAGIPSDTETYYFGSVGGGVWKTANGGQSWQNVSDGFFGGSIGAVAVSESSPSVVYVGGGEKTVRGNVSHGDGMFKSVDAGRTWKYIGLKETRTIPRIRIHPDNPDLVYVAALGHLSGPNPERGVYRSVDGGENWERVLFVNEDAGAVDLVMDPSNPAILYASTWRIKRTPYSLESGGEGSGLWKTVDGGDSWTEITRNRGLPQGVVGISGITVSQPNPDRLWVIIEAEDGGVFRSENGGDSWELVNEDRNLRQRAWYYTRIYADTQDVDTVYVLNVGFHKSVDGGSTYSTLNPPHGDNHDMWIDPNDSSRMIESNDGGANVSYDGGRTWSAQDNQPTAQFYRIITDNYVPYRIYGAQQDNSTVRLRSDNGEWEATAGGESGFLAPDPVDPEIVYGGSYGGLLERRNHRTGESRSINVWPDNPMGWGAAELKHRFQWNYPIFFSPHDPTVLYAAGEMLFKTVNEGQSWEAISPDLTRNEKSMQGSSGGPITKDNTSIEYYCTIFAAMESPHEPGTIWTGSDDGLVYVTRDGGENWTNVTPPEMPEWVMINSLEAHPTLPGGMYVAGTRYKLDDFKPYLYKTTDYGRTWTEITDGIDEEHFTRVLRVDPERVGVLYAGTERGVYVSFDDGGHWQSLQRNLPIVSITDLVVRDGDLIAATQGRSFWALGNLEYLRQLGASIAQRAVHLFTPEPVVRGAGGGGRGGRGRGGRGRGGRGGRGGDGGQGGDLSSLSGAVVYFYLREVPEQEVVLEIMEPDDDVVQRLSSEGSGEERLALVKGMNGASWDMSYPGADGFDGLIMWSGNTGGPRAVPGTYKVRLSVGNRIVEREFEILKSPASSATVADLQAQFDFLMETGEKFTETSEAITTIRDVRVQVDGVMKRATGEGMEDLHTSGGEINSDLTEVEEALYQTQNQSRQDPLNYPIRLNNKLAAVRGVVARGDYSPTDQAVAVKNELIEAIDAQLVRLRSILEVALPAFNRLAVEKGIPHVWVEKKDGR